MCQPGGFNLTGLPTKGSGDPHKHMAARMPATPSPPPPPPLPAKTTTATTAATVTATRRAGTTIATPAKTSAPKSIAQPAWMKFRQLQLQQQQQKAAPLANTGAAEKPPECKQS